MAKSEFPLPDVGEGLTEAEIVSWKVAPGDPVAVNQVLVEIETAKSLVELPSPFEGTVAEILVAEGDTVEVGRPIITVDTGAPAADVSAPPAEETGAPAKPEPTLVGYGTAGHGTSRRRRGAAAAPSTAVPAAPTVAPDAEPHAAAAAQVVGDVKPTTGPDPDVPPAQPELATWAQPSTEPAPASVAPAPASATAHASPAEMPTGVLAKPPVRKLAKDLDIDLATVTATGPAGDVTRDDVLRHARQASALAAAAPAPAPQPAQGDGREERIPVKGVRKAIAGAMVASAFTAPHVSLFVDVDATRTMEFVKRLKNSSEFEGVRVSPLLIMAKAIIWAAKRNPTVNSQWTDDEIIVKNYVNLGIAATTPRGLLVPNVKEAQSMSLLELATALQGLTLRAREGKTSPAEMAGGTITITNIGVFGMDTGTPILNPGEVAIVALGTIKQKPWVVDGVVQPRFVTTVGASFDHRVVDGDVASRFVADVASILEEPALLLE